MSALAGPPILEVPWFLIGPVRSSAANRRPIVRCCGDRHPRRARSAASRIEATNAAPEFTAGRTMIAMRNRLAFNSCGPGRRR
jgi:hypothetical protein